MEEHREALSRVLAFWPHELADVSVDGRKRVLARTLSALRAERRRGETLHWAYSQLRHAALLRAYEAERARLRITGEPWPE